MKNEVITELLTLWKEYKSLVEEKNQKIYCEWMNYSPTIDGVIAFDTTLLTNPTIEGFFNWLLTKQANTTT